MHHSSFRSHQTNLRREKKETAKKAKKEDSFILGQNAATFLLPTTTITMPPHGRNIQPPPQRPLNPPSAASTKAYTHISYAAALHAATPREQLRPPPPVSNNFLPRSDDKHVVVFDLKRLPVDFHDAAKAIHDQVSHFDVHGIIPRPASKQVDVPCASSHVALDILHSSVSFGPFAVPCAIAIQKKAEILKIRVKNIPVNKDPTLMFGFVKDLAAHLGFPESAVLDIKITKFYSMHTDEALLVVDVVDCVEVKANLTHRIEFRDRFIYLEWKSCPPFCRYCHAMDHVREACKVRPKRKKPLPPQPAPSPPATPSVDAVKEIEPQQEAVPQTVTEPSWEVVKSRKKKKRRRVANSTSSASLSPPLEANKPGSQVKQPIASTHPYITAPTNSIGTTYFVAETGGHIAAIPQPRRSSRLNSGVGNG